MPGPPRLPVDLPEADEPGLLTLLAGPAGSGRTTALAGLAEQARGRGRPVLELALDPLEQQTAWMFLARLAREAAERADPDQDALPAGHPEVLVGAVVRLLRRLGDLLVVVDDGQWMDAASVSALPALLRGLAGSRVRCVAAVRTPLVGAPDPVPWLGRLRRAGLLTIRSLRLLDPAALDDLLSAALGVPPHPALRDAVGRAGAGRPGPALAALDGYRARGAVRIAAGRAHLLDPADPPALPADHPLLAPLRQAPEPTWAVGVAMAMLHPLGLDARAVAADGLDLPSDAVAEIIEALMQMGVLRGEERGWRFASPVVAAGLRAASGPYLARRLAQVAVTAVWRGAAQCTDPGALADLLIRAGRSVDAERAARELLWLADQVPMTDGRALRWRAAASELATDSTTRVAALLGLAAAASYLGDHGGVRDAARAAFDETEVAGQRVEAQLLLLRATPGHHEHAEMDDSPVVTATALSMMDHWAEAARRLDSAEPPGAGGRSTAWVLLRERTSAVVGPWHPVSTDTPVVPADPLHRDRLVQRIGTRLVVGDLTGAQQLMRRSRWTEADLPWPERALFAWRHGAWSDALDHGAMAGLRANPLPPVDAVLNRALATITLAQGRPLRARALVAANGAGLPHLRELTEAEIHVSLGELEAAVAGLTRAAAEAARAGVSIGTDEIWLRLTELARSQGDLGQARQYAAQALRAARSVGTMASRLHACLVRLAADLEAGTAAQEALALAREIDQPWVTASTLERVATWRAGPAELLAQAYEQFGELDAILDRARVRTTMRAYGVTVPNRAATAAENERLLAELVADGLTGPQLAAALRTTGKSIESRLGRLFARTGLRSRAALAAAVAGADRRAVGYPDSSASSASSGAATARHEPRRATNARLIVT